MAMGKPVSFTRQGHLERYIVEGRVGAAGRPRGSAGFRTAIERVSEDDELADRLGGNAERRSRNAPKSSRT